MQSQEEQSSQKELYIEPVLTTHERLRDFTTGSAKASYEVPKLVDKIGEFSHPSFKENIVALEDASLLKMVEGIPVYRWNYKDDPEKATFIGGMTTEMPAEVLAEHGMKFNMVSYLGLLTGAVRALSQEVKELRAFRDQHSSSN